MTTYEQEIQRQTGTRLQKELWMINATLNTEKEALLEHLDEHYAFVLDQEAKGVMFAAGPILQEDGTNSGNGVLVMRAESRQQVLEILQDDPFFRHGLRNYEIKRWQVNVGQCQLQVRFSDQSGNML